MLICVNFNRKTFYYLNMTEYFQGITTLLKDSNTFKTYVKNGAAAIDVLLSEVAGIVYSVDTTMFGEYLFIDKNKYLRYIDFLLSKNISFTVKEFKK